MASLKMNNASKKLSLGMYSSCFLRIPGHAQKLMRELGEFYMHIQLSVNSSKKNIMLVKN